MNINRLEKLNIGGLEQTLLVRGTNPDNPILFMLHPMGISKMVFAMEYAVIETHYTVVHWDQRGLGKNYFGKETPDMHLEQILSDTDEIIHWLKKEYPNAKLLLSGESWGSMLALQYAHNNPDKIDGLMLSGLSINMPAALQHMCDNYTEKANKKNKRHYKKLVALTIPTITASDKEINDFYKKMMKWTKKYEASLSFKELKKVFIESFKTSPYYSQKELLSMVKSMSFFSDKMVPAAYRLQAYKQISELKMPVYVFMGENDYLYPESKEFVKKLKAPHKKFIAYPNVGHEVEYFKGEEIMKILIDIKL